MEGSGQRYRRRNASGHRTLAETSLEKVYSAHADYFKNTLRTKFEGAFPKTALDLASADDLLKLEELRGNLQQSPEYWEALDDAYKGFDATLKQLRAQGKLKLERMKLPANEAMAKAEILIRTEYVMAVEGLNSLGLNGAWRNLGKKLRKNLKAQVGVKQSGVSRETAYELLLKNPDSFIQNLKEARNLHEFLQKVTGNEAMGTRIYNELRKGSPTDFKLLQAAVELKIIPDVSELPKVGALNRVREKFYRLGRANLASMWGGAKGMLKLANMIKQQGIRSAIPAFGSRRVGQAAYREFATSSRLYKITLPWMVAGTITGYILYSWLSPKAKKLVGLDTKPKKTPMEDALRGVAATTSNRKAISKMLDEVKVGGRKLTEAEKLRTLKIAGGSKQKARGKTMTDYVRLVAILQAMPGKKANETSKLSKATYAYVYEEHQEKFARKALAISKKNANLTVDAIFAQTMNSPAMKGAVSEEYWGRSFTSAVFGNFNAKGRSNPSLGPLRSKLRKALVEKKISPEQMMGLARMFASIYTTKDARGTEKGFVPKTYEADFEIAMKLAAKGFKPPAIKTAMSSFKGYFSYYSRDRVSTAVSGVLKTLPANATPAQTRGILLEYMKNHEGWLTRGAFSRYASSAIASLVEENAAIGTALTKRKRSEIAGYLSRRFLGTRNTEPLTYAQVVQVVGSLGKYVANSANRDEVRNSRMDVFMNGFVEKEFPPPEAKGEAEMVFTP